MVDQPLLEPPRVFDVGRPLAPAATAIRGIANLAATVAQGVQQSRSRRFEKQVQEAGRGISQVAGNVVSGADIPDVAMAQIRQLSALGVEPTRQVEFQARLGALKGRLRSQGFDDRVIAEAFERAGLDDPELALTTLAIEDQEEKLAADEAAINRTADDILQNNPALAVFDAAGRFDQRATVDSARDRAVQVQRIQERQQANVQSLALELTDLTMGTFIQANNNLLRELNKQTPDPEVISTLLANMSALKTQADQLIASASIGRSQEELDLIEATVRGPLDQLFSAVTGAPADLATAQSIATTNQLLAQVNERGFRRDFQRISALNDVFGSQFIGNLIELSSSRLATRIELGEVLTQDTLDFINGVSRVADGSGILDPGAGGDARRGDTTLPQISGNLQSVNDALQGLRAVTGDIKPEHFQPQSRPDGSTTSVFDTFATSVLGNTSLRSQMDLDDLNMMLDLATSDGFVAALAEQRKQAPDIADRLVGNYSLVIQDVFRRVVGQQVASGDLPRALLEGPLFLVNRETGELSVNPEISGAIGVPAGLTPEEALQAQQQQQLGRVTGRPVIRAPAGPIQALARTQDFELRFNKLLTGFRQVSEEDFTTLLDILQSTGVALALEPEEQEE